MAYTLTDTVTAASATINFKFGSYQLITIEQATTHYPLGTTVPVVLSDGMRGQDGKGTLMTKSAAEEATLEPIVKSINTLSLSDGTNTWHIRRTGPVVVKRLSTDGDPSYYSEIDFTWVGVA